MVIRILMRYLANNEELVQKLSESYPVRRSAQIMVSVFYRSKSLAEEHKLTEFTPEKFRSFVQSFNKNLKEEIEDAKRELKKRQ